VSDLLEVAHGIHGLIGLIQALRENPQITLALSILLVAGAVVATVMSRIRREEPPSIRRIDK
jgi:hypothetical protein